MKSTDNAYCVFIICWLLSLMSTGGYYDYSNSYRNDNHCFVGLPTLTPVVHSFPSSWGRNHRNHLLPDKGDNGAFHHQANNNRFHDFLRQHETSKLVRQQQRQPQQEKQEKHRRRGNFIGSAIRRFRSLFGRKERQKEQGEAILEGILGKRKIHRLQQAREKQVNSTKRQLKQQVELELPKETQQQELSTRDPHKKDDKQGNLYFLFPTSLSATCIHSFFMNLTLEEARNAEHIYDEVPIAASVVLPIGLVSLSEDTGEKEEDHHENCDALVQQQQQQQQHNSVHPREDLDSSKEQSQSQTQQSKSKDAPRIVALVPPEISMPSTISVQTEPLSRQQLQHLVSLLTEKTAPAQQDAKTVTSSSPIVVARDCDNSTSSSLFHCYELLSIQSNRMETLQDASAHAELLALRAAARQIQNWRLLGTTLYTTLEPCPMCLSACLAFRIRNIVYGAPDIRLGAIHSYMNMLEASIHPAHNISNVVHGVEQETCSGIMVDFFRRKRKERKKEKQERKRQERNQAK